MLYVFLFVLVIVFALLVVWVAVRSASQPDMPRFDGCYRDYGDNVDPVPNEPEKPKDPDE